MTEQELNIKIGDRIAQLRQEKGFTQEQLAGMIDSEKQNISRLERGRVNAGVYFLAKIADALEISLAELLTLED